MMKKLILFMFIMMMFIACTPSAALEKHPINSTEPTMISANLKELDGRAIQTEDIQYFETSIIPLEDCPDNYDEIELVSTMEAAIRIADVVFEQVYEEERHRGFQPIYVFNVVIDNYWMVCYNTPSRSTERSIETRSNSLSVVIDKKDGRIIKVFNG